MTVRLRSDRHPLFGPGFALIDFGRPINTPRLEISVLNTITGLYLGPSTPGHPNWVKQRTSFFPAIRAGRGSSSVYRVGPEVTTYIQEGTYVEIAAADDSVREEFSWEGVLLRVSPAGTENWTDRPEAFELSPDGSAASKDSSQPPELEDETRRLEQDQQERSRKEQAAASLAKQKAEEEERQRAEEAARERSAKDIEAARLAAASKAADELAAQERAAAEARAAARKAWLAKFWKYPVGLLLLAAAAAGGYELYSSKYLCMRFGLFCDAETPAFRPAPSDPEKEPYDQAVSCANDMALARDYCGAAACFDEFKRRFPNSTKLGTEQQRIQGDGDACQEKRVYDASAQCATERPCDTACFNTYRVRFGVIGRFKNDMDAAVSQAQGACRTVAQPPVVAPVTQPPPTTVTIRHPRNPDEKPSTDCSRAVKPIDDMLCYDGDLARADGDLGNVYRSKFNGASDKKALKEDEVAWLARRDADCNVPSSRPWTENQLRQSKNCILQTIRERIDELNRRSW